MVKMSYKQYKERVNQIEQIEDIKLKKGLIFYLQTSTYTYLGPYTQFVQTLPEDLQAICTLQRMQTIHARELFFNKNIRQEKDNVNGDMTKVPIDRMNNEEDIFQTAISIFAELLRRNNEYSVHREAKDKIQIVCRGNALMLASTLKAKGIPARVRVGFAKYHEKNVYDDQWNVEYYDLTQNRWIMVDVTSLGSDNAVKDCALDIPKQQFMTAAEAWKNIRNNILTKKEKIMDLGGYEGIKAAWLQLMNDFSCLMNNERSFLFQPIYMYECKNQNWYIRDFKEEELKELDKLADLMLENDKNLEKLYRIYNSQDKYRKLLGISVWN